MLSISEIIGSEKPILLEKEVGMLTLDEIVNINENTTDYEHVGFIQTDEVHELFQKVYSKKSSLEDKE